MRVLGLVALLAPLMLAGCSVHDMVLFFPAGPMAASELHYTYLITGIMMVIIVPTLLMSIWFPIKYHISRQHKEKYTPDWTFSYAIEVLAWGIPLGIVAVLAWLSVHGIRGIDPWNPPLLAKIAPNAPVEEVDVIATDWQWVFIYPAEKLVTIDELTIPAGARIDLKLTATQNMDGFYIPQVAPMVDAMPAMQTKDTFLVSQPGDFTGFSTDFSGAGFSWMRFAVHAVSTADFAAWVQSHQGAAPLDYAAFDAHIAQPQVNYGATPSYFTLTDPKLFGEVISAAQMGKTYPVSQALNKAVADDDAAPVAGAQ